jgi:hypothetical protein
MLLIACTVKNNKRTKGRKNKASIYALRCPVRPFRPVPQVLDRQRNPEPEILEYEIIPALIPSIANHGMEGATVDATAAGALPANDPTAG